MRRVAAARTLCACALVLALVLSSSAASVLAHEQRVLHAPHVAHASDADDCEATAPVVQTVQGPVLGKCYTVATPPSTSSPSSSTSTSVCVCSFRGVPFAASTGGANRFRPPQPRAAWSPAVWNATVYGPGCPQTHHNPDVPPVQSEDCLNLNVWLPRSALGNGTLELEHKQQQGAQQQQQQQQQQLLPVSLFMHGGSFEEGGGNIPFYECGYVAGNGRAGAGSICITINYRLGPLGWLVTDTVGGNMGLMDQRAALQWVRVHCSLRAARAHAARRCKRTSATLAATRAA
jgi:acetyl esterase/lipase